LPESPGTPRGNEDALVLEWVAQGHDKPASVRRGTDSSEIANECPSVSDFFLVDVREIASGLREENLAISGSVVIRDSENNGIEGVSFCAARFRDEPDHALARNEPKICCVEKQVNTGRSVAIVPGLRTDTRRDCIGELAVMVGERRGPVSSSIQNSDLHQLQMALALGGCQKEIMSVLGILLRIRQEFIVPAKIVLNRNESADNLSLNIGFRLRCALPRNSAQLEC
jgi:hypothetical protein